MMPRLILLMFVVWSLGAGLLRGLSRPKDAKAQGDWLTLIELAQIEHQPRVLQKSFEPGKPC